MLARLLKRAALLLALTPLPALAHPHVFVDARLEVVFDAGGQVTALRNVWRFDDAFSSFAAQGLDADGDGVYSAQELAPLAKVNVESLKDYDYFTIPKFDGKRIGLKLPTDYSLRMDDGFLTLFFTLPLMQPVKPGPGGLAVEVFDPSYFVDYTLVEAEPALLIGAPPKCALAVKKKGAPDAGSAALLGQIPATERELPRALKDLTQGLANRVTVTCP